jgi:hypothetical protein
MTSATVGNALRGVPNRRNATEGAPYNLPRQGILRYSRWDALLVVLALAQGALLLAVPLLPVVALGLWWNCNTIAHCFIHRPFFRSAKLNTLFALYETALVGVPQTIWRGRHLAHHAGTAWRFRLTGRVAVELLIVLSLWSALLVWAPRFFLTVYVPGYVLGLALCYLHGYYEHRDGTTSHYGAVYNFLFFNDGYHVEHHANPSTHWTELRARGASQARAPQLCARCCSPLAGAAGSQGAAASPPSVSPWPAVLRWFDAFSLDGLERWVLRWPLLQRFVLRCHQRAFRKLLPAFAQPPRVCIVGGGLFPRTLLVLQRLLPQARFRVVDRSAENLALAQALLPNGADLEVVHEEYEPARLDGADLVVFPLAFIGDRAAIYHRPPAPFVLVHDWLWRRRGRGTVVSWLLLKRLNLVQPGSAGASPSP